MIGYAAGCVSKFSSMLRFWSKAVLCLMYRTRKFNRQRREISRSLLFLFPLTWIDDMTPAVKDTRKRPTNLPVLIYFLVGWSGWDGDLAF